MRVWYEELAPSVAFSPNAVSALSSTLGSGSGQPQSSQPDSVSGSGAGPDGVSAPALLQLAAARADGLDAFGACAAILFAVNHQTRYPFPFPFSGSYSLQSTVL